MIIKQNSPSLSENLVLGTSAKLLIVFSAKLNLLCPGFYPSAFVYNCFSPKIQFLYCLLSLVALLGCLMVDTEGEILEI